MPVPDRLPQEPPVPATRGRVLVALAVTLVVVTLLNLVAGRTLDRFTTNRGYWLVREKWALLESLPAPVDWLILGDSSCNQGIKPDLITAELGGTAVNLCTVGDMLAVNDAWMLDRHIERLGPPKHVVIAHVYDMWARDLRALNRQPLLAKVPLPWAYWRTTTPALPLEPADERRLWVARYLPLWSENKTLATWLRHPGVLWQRDLSMTPEGFMAYDKANPGLVRRESKSHIDGARKRRFSLSKINRDALEHIRALADQHGFDVYIAAGPLYEGMWSDDGFKRHFQAMMKALDALAARSPRMHVLLHEPATYGVKQLENADHLVGPAAADYTRRLIAAIQQTAQEKRP
jgi:hypothetical protein